MSDQEKKNKEQKSKKRITRAKLDQLAKHSIFSVLTE